MEISGFTMTTGRKKLNERNVIMKSRWVAVRCKYCGEQEKVVHHGRTPKYEQRYRCLACGHTFLDNQAKGRMQYTIEVVASALNMFYEGLSLSEIRRQLQLGHNVSPDDSTIYKWIVRYSKKAAKALNSVPVKAGPKWVADETVLKLKEQGGSNIWFWDVIDAKTRLLLGSHISEGRTTRDAQALMEKAAERAGKTPKVVITDKLASYLDGVELAFGSETEHLAAKKLTAKPGTQLIERFHGTLKARTKVMRSLWRKGTAKVIMEGWLSHYNFFRPHKGLGGKTPAEVAGAVAPYQSWRDVVEKG